MVGVSDRKLSIRVEGWDRMWSMRSHLEIPLEHVSRAYADPNVDDTWWKGWRRGGTNLPGVLTAGTFYRQGWGAPRWCRMRLGEFFCFPRQKVCLKLLPNRIWFAIIHGRGGAAW